ncbi:hypothetical protein [Flavobacterium sp.]|uniref:hypothetical protein n=1 Tax=Flavobacterium sp. TaxID=239 RepID=UPI002FDB113A
MKIIFTIVIILLLVSCDKEQRQKGDIDLQTIDTIKITKKETSYTDQQLEIFLDSIGNFTPSYFADNVSFVADSIFKNQLQMNKVISQSDFSKLKFAINEEDEILRTIDIKTAKNIFGEIQVDSSFVADGKIPITFFSFDKRKEDFNEFAICLGYTDAGEFGWSCVLYFFKNNKIIAKHNIYHRYGLELNHYKDSDGKTIIYYKENFGSGTGIWQFNFYFYKFYNDKLIPILNVLENGNLNSWGRRNFWLETFVTKTNPLTLKMVYHQFFYGTKGEGDDYRIIDDSTFIQFKWDEKSRTLIGNYEKSKTNKFKILTYYLDSNELLFINTYYTELKNGLKNKTKRHIILNYLNGIKNHYENK